MEEIQHKRITIFTGHYGSGKTNLAINWAIMLKKKHNNVAIADLDIVNPYNRTKDSSYIIRKNGIHLIASEYAGTNLDIPSLPAETFTITDNKNIHAVIDVGGDDRGALALGRWRPAIVSENNYEMLFVVNRFRPLTKSANDALAVMREIENASGIRCTAIVANHNLGSITNKENILESVSYTEELSLISGLPIKFYSVDKNLSESLGYTLQTVFPLDYIYHTSECLDR